MEQVKDVELPFFYGFYNSPFEIQDWDIEDKISYYNEFSGETDINFNDLDIDYAAHQQAMVESFVERFKEYLPSWVVSIDEYELDSPKFYNFRTDKIYATITLADDWREKIAQFVKENFDWLEKRIEKDWTSRSGFNSWIENRIGEFVEKAYEPEPRYISILIGYDIELKNEGEDMYERMVDETIEEFSKNYSTNEFIYLNKDLETSNDNGEETTETTADDIRKS
ncbi:MAG: hypothetical protein J6X18_04720 [Bacteroidales bacterium]|nr:hypothetical protein [Bacteroidales bacterium]